MGLDAVLKSPTYPRLGIGFMASLRLTTFFRMSSDAGLVWFRPPPVRKSSSLKQFLKATGRICKKEQSVFHLSEPSFFYCKLPGVGQAVAEPSKPCPL